MSIKKIYLVLCVIVISFLAYQCGGNSNNNDVQSDDSQMETTDNSSVNELTGNSEMGKDYFMQTCAACHGTDAKGLPKLGKNLVTSQFVQEKSEKELMKFIEEGRLPSDPLNTTGVAMPPKGGNPALNDQKIMDIVSYLKSIHQ